MSKLKLIQTYRESDNLVDWLQRFVGTVAEVENWNSVTFEANWSQYSNTSFGTVGYYLDPFGRVHLRGLATHTTGGATTNIFQLPTGYRPSKHKVFTQTANSALAEIDILSSGFVLFQSGTATTWASLDGISFRV